MTVLRSIEHKIEALFEGVFGRAFRAHVQPVELARKLAKEMDDHRTPSVSRVYVPNEYTVYLSPNDREQFEGYESSLVGELEEYLDEHAWREQYALLSRPRVVMESDDDLAMGEFGIATRMAQPEPGGRGDGAVLPAGAPAAAPAGPPVGAEPGATMIYRPKAPDADATGPAEAGLAREFVALEFDGERREVAKRRIVIGRSKDCDIQLPDPNVSRRHAEVRQEGAQYWVVDLGSTNGMEVNGRRARRAKLSNGDRITLGSTDLVFRRGQE